MGHLLSITVAATNTSLSGCQRSTRWEILAMMRTVGKLSGFCAVIFILTLTAKTAYAIEPTILFNIPRQNAGDALPAFGLQADISVIYQYDLVKRHETNRLRGEYTIPEAMDILLENTGLEASFENGRHLIVIKVNNQERQEKMAKNPKKNILAAMIGVLFGADGAQYAFAQSTGEVKTRSETLEEVVVTAQKREQSYTDVPLAVSAFSGETLELAEVSEFQDLVQVSPSLTYNQSGDQRGVGILVRGIGTTAFSTAVEPTVSTVVDSVVMGRTAQFISDLADVERVEVLRGPQGTLFGKNASAGLLHIITKRPAEEFQATVRGSLTDDDAWSTSASVSGAVTDTVRARLAAYKKEYDGFGKNLFTGHDINGDESWGVRGKLDIDISDRTNLYLIGDYSKQDRNCCTFFLEDVAGDRFRIWDYEQYGISLDGNERNNVTLDAEDGFSDTETYGVSAELNVEFDKFILTSITAYRDFELQTNQGIDNMPYAGPTYGRLIFTSNGAYDGKFKGGAQEQEQFSQELRIASTAWDSLQLTGGLFYWNQTVDRYFEREVFLCLSPSAGDLSLSPDPALTPCTSFLNPGGFFDSSVDSKNWAAFGQADWSFADRWKLSLGLRYTEDDLDVEFERQTTPGPAVPPPGSGSASTSEDQVTGKLALLFDLTDNAMLYASYSEGYKAPAYDMLFGVTEASLANPVPPETSKAWETGIKSELFDNRLRLGLTLFYTEFSDLQGQASNPNDVGFILTSAGTAITKGVEFEFTAKPTANWLLNGGVSYTDAYYDNYTDGQCWPGQTVAEGCTDGTQDLSGEQISNAPEWKISVQSRYDIVLDAPFDAFVSGTYRWQDQSPGNVNHWAPLDHDSYGILDLVVGLEADDGRWNGHIFVKNVLDDFYVDLKTVSPNSQRVNHYLSRDAERYIGVNFEYRLGAL